MFLELNLHAFGWTTLNSCFPIAKSMVMSTKTDLWSPTPLWNNSCTVDVFTSWCERHTQSIGSVPLKCVWGSSFPHPWCVTSVRPIFNMYFPRWPLRMCLFISIKIMRQLPCCCQVWSCAIKFTTKRSAGKRFNPLFWLYLSYCWYIVLSPSGSWRPTLYANTSQNLWLRSAKNIVEHQRPRPLWLVVCCLV
jgi:hypothetical protein